MKNKLSTSLVVAVLVSSALAFVYLNSCGLPVGFAEANANLVQPEIVESDYSDMADVKLVQFVLNKLVAIFTSH